MQTTHKLNDNTTVKLKPMPGGMVEINVQRGVFSFLVYVPMEAAYELAQGLDLAGVEACRMLKGALV